MPLRFYQLHWPHHLSHVGFDPPNRAAGKLRKLTHRLLVMMHLRPLATSRPVTKNDFTVKNSERTTRDCTLALLLTTILMVGCGGGTASVTKPAGSIGATRLAVFPSAMTFGSVPVGDSKALPGTLTATNGRVTVSSAAWSGEGYSVGGISFPVIVPAGQNVSFVVTFGPQAAGSAPGSISFVSDASNSPGAQTLSGDGGQQPGGAHSVSLSWSPSASPVMGYHVYRGTHNGGPYPTKLTSSPQPGTSYDDITVQSGLTYFYVATSISSEAAESSYSNQTTAAIP
jgi:hypothetical protein